MEQRTDEWHQARLGKVTASKIADVMAKGRGNAPSATRENYEAQLIAERLTGRPTEGFSSAAMQWGTDNEDQARSAYSFIEDVDVEEVGFVDHPAIDMAGASPDGLVGTNGLVEIKCPNTATHLRFIENGTIDRRYLFQMNWQMACTGRQWCDFVSYDPRLPENLGIRILRVMRDDELIEELEGEVGRFLASIEDRVRVLEGVSIG